MKYAAGLDIGSSFAKVVVIDEKGNMLGSAVQRTGIDFNKIAEALLQKALSEAGIDSGALSGIVATGIGRNGCLLTVRTKPEIGCFAKASFFLFGGPAVVIDIGGQDNKIIKFDESGKQTFFRMNRKCAAGTGSFLEEISLKLDLPVAEMNAMASKADTSVAVGSFCTVFAGTEVIHHLRAGENTLGIMRGVYESVVKRVLEMAPIDNTVILTGGAIATNPILAKIFSERITFPIKIAPQPQLVGAHGAALYALEKEENDPSQD